MYWLLLSLFPQGPYLPFEFLPFLSVAFFAAVHRGKQTDIREREESVDWKQRFPPLTDLGQSVVNAPIVLSTVFQTAYLQGTGTQAQRKTARIVVESLV